MSNPLRVKVNIADDDLVILREGGFNLCLSRDAQFEGMLVPGNVVFASVPSKRLAPHVSVQWKDEYQVYETQHFAAGQVVTIATEVRDIIGDQEATFDENGAVKISGGYQPGAAFRVDNEWKDGVYIGVSNYNVGNDNYSSFFVSPEVKKPSTTSILPMHLYAVFWDVKLTTDTMFDPASVNRFAFALMPGSVEVILTYEDGEWALTLTE